MEWLLANWLVIVVAIVAIIGIGIFAYKFIKLPADQKWKKVRAWLLYAVAYAEKQFGSKTGKLKLALAYDLFISKFKFAKAIMPFETFEILIDSALSELRKLVETNPAIAEALASEIVVEGK